MKVALIDFFIRLKWRIWDKPKRKPNFVAGSLFELWDVKKIDTDSRASDKVQEWD